MSSRETIPLGLLFSTSGNYRAVGNAMLSGALLGIEQVAADPGYGFCFNPQAANPAGHVARYYAQAEDLLRYRSVSHVIGCYTSSSRKEVVPLFEQFDGLLWYPSHYEGFECSSNVIYVGAAPNQHIVPLARYLMSTLGKRVLCIGSNYVWAWESNRVMREIVEADGGAILAERYHSVGAKDFERAVDEICELKPDFIFTSLIGESSQAFIRAYGLARHQRRIEAGRSPMASCTLSEADLQCLDPEVRDGHIASSVYFQSIDRPVNHDFVRRYKERFGASSMTSADAEAAYISVLLLAMAIKKADSADVAAVRAAVPACRLDAPQGLVRIDRENNHCYVTPRLGVSTATGDFRILSADEQPMKPDPYLVWFDAARDISQAPRNPSRAARFKVIK
jgi:ABC-type branched-subunit amino acid transport system substrate-binding protein